VIGQLRLVKHPKAFASPLQPVNVEPEPGAAVSVTTVPGGYVVLHDPGQLIPVTSLVMVPVPIPVLLIVTDRVGLTAAKFAVTGVF